jgi:hypothetical protein
MTLRNVLALVWCQVSFILGVVGNSFILYSTVCHKAIKMDKLSVWIIQNLALSDLVTTILVLIPILIHLYDSYCERWILGDTFRVINLFYKAIGAVANALLITALGFNKLMRCLFPLRYLDTSKTQRWLVTMAIAPLTMIVPVYQVYLVVVLHDDFVAEFFSAQCQIYPVAVNSTVSKVWRYTTDYVLTGMFNFLPCVSMCTINTILIIYALTKTKRTVNKKNIMIVVLVTASYLLSMLPYFISRVILKNTPGSDNDNIMPFAGFIMLVQLWTNPVICLATNEKFRTFTINLIRKKRNSGIQ